MAKVLLHHNAIYLVAMWSCIVNRSESAVNRGSESGDRSESAVNRGSDTAVNRGSESADRSESAVHRSGTAVKNGPAITFPPLPSVSETADSDDDFGGFIIEKTFIYVVIYRIENIYLCSHLSHRKHLFM